VLLSRKASFQEGFTFFCCDFLCDLSCYPFSSRFRPFALRFKVLSSLPYNSLSLRCEACFLPFMVILNQNRYPLGLPLSRGLRQHFLIFSPVLRIRIKVMFFLSFRSRFPFLHNIPLPQCELSQFFFLFSLALPLSNERLSPFFCRGPFKNL